MSSSDRRYSDYYDEKIETLPRAGLEALQESAILALTPWIYERSGLTRHTWDKAGIKPGDIRSLDDFRNKVPFTDKDAIRAFRDQFSDPYGGLKCVDAPIVRSVGFTSGTTGDPTPLPFAQSSSAPELKRDFWHIGMRPGDYFTMNVFTFREGHCADRYTDCDFRPILFQHMAGELGRMIANSIEYQPKVMFTMSTPMVLAFEEYAQKHNVDLKAAFASYRGVVFGGEVPAPRVRKLIASWGLDMFQTTSLGDVTGAIDCRYHTGFHCWEDMVLVECLDPNGSAPVADGERGELVVTSLQDRVAPLIRYRTDDLITLNREPCQCGRTHARIQVLGRKGDELIIAGRSILPRDITPVIEEFEETNSGLFQIIRSAREMDVLRLRLGYKTELLSGDTGELIGRISERLRAELGVPIELQLTPNAELLKLGPPHKIPRVTKQ